MNHQKEAERLAALEPPSAQTHAILAVAEQLRAANLIALWNAEDKSHTAAQIAEALGIEQP